jgi:hypothetical protein
LTTTVTKATGMFAGGFCFKKMSIIKLNNVYKIKFNLMSNVKEKAKQHLLEKYNKVIAAQEELWNEGNGFFDKSLLDKLAMANFEWKKTYSEFQNSIQDN